MKIVDKFPIKKNIKLYRVIQNIVNPNIVKNEKYADSFLDGVKVRVFDPWKSQKLIIYIHGGGWVSGNLDTHSNICFKLASDLKRKIISIGYRLAPEYPYPAGFDDCYKVIKHIMNNISSFGIFWDDVVLMGDSAGGNLAFALSLKGLYERTFRVGKLVLIYPATQTDYTKTTKYCSVITNDGKGFLTRKHLEDYINNDTWISISSVCNLPNSKEIIAHDTSYKNDGNICKEEKEILIDMIDEFIRKIDGTLNNNMQNINENVDDNSSILLTLKEWWGEGSYGHKAIHVFYDGKVLLKEENTIIRENGKKKRMEKNEHIATLDESDLDCLTNIIQVINNNFSNQEIPIICDYGVEVIINCGPLNICIENDEELYDSLKNIVETLIERTKKQAELDYNAIKDIFIMKYFDEGKVNKLKEDVKSKNIEIEKDLCTTLIYFCLATLPDDKQTLETIYTLIDSYKNNINNTIQKFDCEHPIHKYNNKLKSLTELELDEIINILKNKLYYCKNIAQFREMLYLVCCDEDIQFISKCVIELQKDEKIEEYIKTQVNDDNQEAINYIKNIEITEDFPLISKLKENLENLL